MTTTFKAADAKTHFSRLLRQVEAGETIAISKRDETVAFLVPRARLEALVETIEVLGNSAAMQAIRQHEAGKLSFYPVSALDEDEGWEDDRGDIKQLEGDLADWCRLRVTSYRVIFRYEMEENRRIARCVFAERRELVYELFAEAMRHLLDQ
jgi:prevent-host-death family protein